MSENEAPVVLEEVPMAKVGEPEPKQTQGEVKVDPVGDYPERPYSEAVSDEQRAALREAGVEI